MMKLFLAVDSFSDLVALVGNGGGAVAVIVVVVMFLKHMREAENKRGEHLEKIGRECHEHQDRIMTESHEHQKRQTEATAEVIRQNSDVIRENTKMLGMVAGRIGGKIKLEKDSD